MIDYDFNSVLYFADRILFLLSTIISSFVLFIKFRSIIITKKKIIILICTIVGVPIICQMLGGINQYIYVRIIYIALMCVGLILLENNKDFVSLSTSIACVAIGLCLQYICVSIISFIFFILHLTHLKIVASTICCVFQVLICILLSNNKRLKKCFIYFEKENNAGLGMLLASFIFIFSLLLTQQMALNANLGMLLLVVCPLALTGLILWIRSIVKRYYKNKLQDRMDKYTKQEIEDKDKRIERLEAEVTSLAKQVHRDNHLMTSVDHSMQELAECDSAEQREKIIGEIHTLYLERNDSMAKEQQKNKILPSIGFALIDSSLSELYVKAAARGIGFDLTVSEEPYYLVNNIISQTDLQTLLCDHIKDAIIAVETAGITNGRILVTIEKNDSIFEITIRDNGVDFEPDTLAKLGREQVTTHADDGGSGIGFMTTFETLYKTKGSLIITEYEQKTPFSKSVAFVFDGLNRFVISTYRKEELEKAIDRDDILIL